MDEDAIEENGPRRLPRGVVAALLLVAVVAIIFGARALARHYEEKRIATEWARFSRCLIGPTPLAATETPSSRLRLIELGVLERKLSHAPDPADSDWPKRCAKYAEALRQEEEPFGAIASAMKDATSTLDRGDMPSAQTSSEKMALDLAFQRAATLRGEPDDVSDVPLPPKAIELLDTSKIAKLSNESQIWDAVPLVDRSVRFMPWRTNAVWEIEGSPDAAKTLLRARETKISPLIEGLHAKLIGGEDGAAPVFAHTGTSDGGLYSGVTGMLLAPSPSATEFGGWVNAKGFVATIDNVVVKPNGERINEATYQLVRRHPDGTANVTRTALDRPKWSKDRVASARVFAGWLFWIEGPYAADTTLFAREIHEGDPAVGPVVEIGSLPKDFLFREGARVCRSDGALFVEVADSSSVAPARFVAGFAEGRWHAPVRVEGARGVLTCSGGRALYTGVDVTGPSPYDGSTKAPAEIHRTTCTFDACKHESVTLPEVTVTRDDIKVPRVSAISLAGNVVAFAERGILRVAPLADLPRARARILVPRDVPLDSVTLFGRQGLGIVLLGVGDGERALRVDANGALAPVDLLAQ